VTDRLHMRRAAGAFVQQGFDVERASVPIYEGHPDNLSMLRAGVREMVALEYYRRKGWVADVRSSSRADGPRPPAAAAIGTAGTGASIVEEMAIQQPAVNAGPMVILGASYAKNWTLGNINGVPVVTSGVAGQQSF
jgi:hypothetical protein